MFQLNEKAEEDKNKLILQTVVIVSIKGKYFAIFQKFHLF